MNQLVLFQWILKIISMLLMKAPFWVISSGQKNKILSEITEHYTDLFLYTVWKTIVVLDGHKGKPSTKDMDHLKCEEKTLLMEFCF